MNKFSELLQNKLVPITNKFASLPFMIVLRSAIMTIVPLMIVGAVGTLMTNLPFEAAANFVAPAAPFFTALTNVTSNISGLVVVIGVGYYGSQHYNLDPIYGITAALASFFAASLSEELTIDTGAFGATGIFTAIIIGFISIYILNLCKKYRLEIRMPDGVPPAVAGSFSVIIALAISVALVLLVRIGLNLDVNTAITNLFMPLANILNTLPGLMLYSVLASLLFICGINPGVITGFLAPVFALNAEANAAALAAGISPTGFVTWGMYTIMACGGTGGTIGLSLLLLTSKAKAHKTLGKISILPSLFNINEPIIYGFPIMFNPVMFIPFILVPLINITATWLLMSSDIIGRIFIDIPWSTPAIFNGFLMTGGDIRTAIWTGIVVIISMACYYPFFKIAEKQELAIEQGIEEN
ncbi:PTS sugar transporter subunit IIC [Breznakia pachnodae]|uniref:Permease IIC component n=1 Tax=Breznakia pachnodae TaxID=265178 RepID=A0ABU0E314_9FIRM|nr:PTS transporter subunit EIIC [Breznakia pachnodae]MDQ0361116.1 PTS system cellobiose-specific IIC component [Breznakia pachnodae]